MGVAVYYVVLGLDPRATDDQIHRAYRQRTLEYWSSPERTTALMTRRFRAVEEAYSVLGDATRRAAYDAQLAAQANRAARTTVIAPPPREPAPMAQEAAAITPGPAPTAPKARGRAFPRPHPSLIIALLLAPAIIGIAGGPHRAASDRSADMAERQSGQSPSPQARGVPTALHSSIVAAVTGPGPALRRLARANAVQALPIGVRPMPDHAAASISTRHMAASGTRAPWIRTHRVIAGDTAPSLNGSGPSSHQGESATSPRGQTLPRTIRLMPGDGAVPARPQAHGTAHQGRVHVEPAAGSRHQGGRWKATQWRRAIRQGYGWRRPRASDGHASGRIAYGSRGGR